MVELNECMDGGEEEEEQGQRVHGGKWLVMGWFVIWMYYRFFQTLDAFLERKCVLVGWLDEWIGWIG